MVYVDFGPTNSATRDIQAVNSVTLSDTQILIPAMPPQPTSVSLTQNNVANIIMGSSNSYILTTTNPWKAFGFEPISPANQYTY